MENTMNYSILILTLLGIVSDLIELTYNTGVFTRKHILPGVVYTYVLCEHLWDKLTTMEIPLRVYRTPLTTGFA